MVVVEYEGYGLNALRESATARRSRSNLSAPVALLLTAAACAVVSCGGNAGSGGATRSSRRAPSGQTTARPTTPPPTTSSHVGASFDVSCQGTPGCTLSGHFEASIDTCQGPISTSRAIDIFGVFGKATGPDGSPYSWAISNEPQSSSNGRGTFALYSNNPGTYLTYAGSGGFNYAATGSHIAIDLNNAAINSYADQSQPRGTVTGHVECDATGAG